MPRILTVVMFAFVAAVVQVGISSSASAVTVTQVSAGSAHACAIAEGKARCWGNNGSGQLGNNSKKTSSVPVDVYTKAAWTEVQKDKGECLKRNFLNMCTENADKIVNHQATALSGKTITKISAGQYHTCAVASARVYCWGDNGNGRLGNNSTKDVSQPTLVTSTGALRGKELVDVAAGGNFSCALATDGTVACWGGNTDGQLGTGNRVDSKVPIAVSRASYKAAVPAHCSSDNLAKDKCKGKNAQGETRRWIEEVPAILASDLNGKRVKKLAKLSGDSGTMCAITTDNKTVCWGYGIDDGSALPVGSTATVKCDRYNAPTSKPRDTSSTTIFSYAVPREIPGASIAEIDGDTYVTGLSTDGKAYYWGMYGYREDAVYTDIKKCSYTCNGIKVGIVDKIELAKASVTRGGFQGTRAGFGARGGVASSGGGNSFSMRVAPPTGGQTTTTNGGGCSITTHYGYTKATTYTTIGKNKATLPTATAITADVRVLSGNAYNGLYCATVSTGLFCDGNGTTTKAGQLGDGSSAQRAAGPHAVAVNGWLSGKTVTQLSTGASGYTCAIASSMVGCWGENGSGQLGNGDTKDKNIPVGVGM